MKKKNINEKFTAAGYWADADFHDKLSIACLKAKLSKSEFIRQAILEKIKKDKLS